MAERWGALPLGEEPRGPGRCVDCGEPTAPGYEHCDNCLRLAAVARFQGEKQPRRMVDLGEMIELMRDL